MRKRAFHVFLVIVFFFAVFVAVQVARSPFFNRAAKEGDWVAVNVRTTIDGQVRILPAIALVVRVYDDAYGVAYLIRVEGEATERLVRSAAIAGAIRKD